ncbi:protein MGARP isoform X2, partial [Silurus asotus]
PAVEKAPESLIVAASKDQLSGEAQVVVADVTTSDEATAPPAVLEEPEPKHEFVIVVLEGVPETEKKHKVLGVSPMVGRIIPS